MSITNTNTGPLLLIGGAEDKIGGRAILRRFVQLAGGFQGHIAIVATASGFHDAVGKRYTDLFNDLGAGEVTLLGLHDRAQAQSREPLQQLDDATGIFITGGDQLKLTALLGGTAVFRCIRERFRAGAAVAGTSAGASVAPEHMLAYGQSGIPPRKAMMHFAPGLGLIDGLVVDQHFSARGRAGRLMTAVAHNPDLLGIGLDEDTAVEIVDGQITVQGSGAVLVVDGSELTYSDIHYVPDGAPLTMFGLRIHTLSRGYQFDLATRTPHRPAVLPPIFPDMQGVGGEGI